MKRPSMFASLLLYGLHYLLCRVMAAEVGTFNFYCLSGLGFVGMGVGGGF
jgi:hypothetical protein